MAPIKKKLSRDEILLRKRLRERERYQQMKNDPLKKELMKDKERKKYNNKKLKNQVKSIKDMTPREARVKRKQWRTNSISYIKRKKQGETQVLPDSPPSSCADEPPVVAPFQRNAGRKRVLRDRSKIVQRNKRLIVENNKLRKCNEKYKKRYYRLLNKSNTKKEMTPNTKVKRIMRSRNNNIIARRLLFGEVLEAQMKSNLSCIKSSVEKHSVLKNVFGTCEMLKKYKIMKDVQRIGNLRPGRYISTNNYLAKRRLASCHLRIKNEVKKFLEEDEHSRMAPGKKDTVTHKKQKMQKRYLNDTMKTLHNKFVSSNNIKISYSFFCKLRPFWIVYQTLTERQTCLCQKHENTNFVVSALAQNNVVNEKTAKVLVEKLCCDGYRVDCLLRRCALCKEKEVNFNEFDGDTETNYYCWVLQQQEYKDKTGQIKKVKNTIKIKKKVTLYELTRHLLNILEHFMKHEAVILNQYSALKYLKHTMGENEALLQIDFSENYALKYGSEIQSFHFGGSRKQVSLHTCSVAFKESTYGCLKYKSICTFSESLKHDPPAILAHMEPVFNVLNELKPNLRALHLVSDSPSNQYRNKLMFFQFAKLIDNYFPKLEVSTWNYLEAGHGKGVADGIGGTVKRTADRQVCENKDIDSFTSLISGLKDNLRSIEIYTVNDNEIEKVRNTISFNEVKPFKGTMQVHQVVHINSEKPNVLFMKSMSCFKCLKEKGLLNKNDLNCKHFTLGQLDYFNPRSDVLMVEEYLEVVIDPDEVRIMGMESQDNMVQEMNEDMATSIIPSCSTENNEKNEQSGNKLVEDEVDARSGTFVLVRFKNESKKSSTCHQFLGICQSNVQDSEIKVMFFKNVSGDKTVFSADENDVSFVLVEQIVATLAPPTIISKGRRLFYKFQRPLPVF